MEKVKICVYMVAIVAVLSAGAASAASNVSAGTIDAIASNERVSASISASSGTGSYVATVNFSKDCGVGVGIAYDATNLWYSCAGSGNNSDDLFRADSTGTVTASYNIIPNGGLGALSYDATRNVIWAGDGGGGPGGGGEVYRIDLDAAKNVVGSALVFDVEAVVGACGLDDGLAFDARTVADPNDDRIYYSNDCSTTTIRTFDLNGNLVESFNWAGNASYNSGLAVGGQLLYQGSDGASHVWVVDKTSKALQFDFPTNVVLNDPNFRDEDLECDTNTFAPTDVMWSKEAYSPMRAHAFEIPKGTCGIGGGSSQPTKVPAFTPIGIAALAGLLGLVAVVAIRRRL